MESFMSNTLQPIELTDSDLDAVSGGDCKDSVSTKIVSTKIDDSFNSTGTATAGDTTNVVAGGEVTCGNADSSINF
jgi:hypothetical protein